MRVVPSGRAVVGDVILFEGGKNLVVHRVVAKVPGGMLVHLGDGAGWRGAGFLKADRMIGRVLARRRPPSLGRMALGLIGAVATSFVAVLAPSP